MFPKIWQAGKVVDRSEFRIDPADETLLFGRGVFTTTKIWAEKGRVAFWPAHQARLVKSLAALQIELTAEQLPSEADLVAFAREVGVGDVAVRVNVSAAGQVWATARAIAAFPDRRVVFASQHRLDPHFFLNDFKTMNWGLRLLATREAERRAAFDVLLFDHHDHLLEASRGNVFLRLETGWVTPALIGGILPGIAREFVIQNLPVTCRQIERREFEHVQAIVLTNSVMGIVAATHWQQKPLAEPSPEISHLSHSFQNASAGEV